MRYTEVIYLITNKSAQDEIGNFVSTDNIKQKCFAKKQSVKTSEFYNAIKFVIIYALKFFYFFNHKQLPT